MRVIEIAGKAVGKGRPRASAHNGAIQMYTPKSTKKYEDLVRNTYVKKYGDKGPLAGPLEINISIYVAPPKSASKKAKTEMIAQGYPCKKPDVDNVAKTIMDALNGIAYTDDSQIVRLHISRRYTEESDRVVVGVGEIEDDSEE